MITKTSINRSIQTVKFFKNFLLKQRISTYIYNITCYKYHICFFFVYHINPFSKSFSLIMKTKMQIAYHYYFQWSLKFFICLYAYFFSVFMIIIDIAINKNNNNKTYYHKSPFKTIEQKFFRKYMNKS